MQDTTLTESNSSDEILICPWTGQPLDLQELKDLELQREQVRKRLVELYSSSPFWQAKAAKDPEFWNKFYVGRVR